MAKADLYLIQGEGFSDQVNFCCRLSEKAFSLGHSIHILTAESYQNEAIDVALWSFKAESFIPHEVLSASTSPDLAVTISALSQPPPGKAKELLISTSLKLLEDLEGYKRIAIIVVNEEQAIAEARTLFRHLKALNFDVQTHDLRR